MQRTDERTKEDSPEHPEKDRRWAWQLLLIVLFAVSLAWLATCVIKFGRDDLQRFVSGFGNFSSPQNAFLSGRVAMELQGVWMHNFVDKYAHGMDWAAAPFPYPSDRPDLRNSTPVEEDVLCIPVGAKHPAEAFEFIRYVNTREGSELLNMGQRKFTPLLDVSPAFLQQHPNPFIRVFIDLARSPNAFIPPQMPLWQEYSNDLQAAFDQTWLCSKTPDQALRDVEARMQRKLDRDLRRYARMGIPYADGP
jgi:multiple sugar transport system substrate-binding protein